MGVQNRYLYRRKIIRRIEHWVQISTGIKILVVQYSTAQTKFCEEYGSTVKRNSRN